ncbi:transposase family protein [Streptomyces sp. NPDC086082]|uniref:transposase family protein n=1 Tax=Streptomyces sp. NPDC086082 TaxID=3365750 RepID=UPI0037F564FA
MVLAAVPWKPRTEAACRNVPLWDILHMGAESLADVLFAGFDVRLTRVTKAAEGLAVEAVACGPPPRCTGCNSQATRVHSSYGRGLAGLPVNGRSLTVRLRVRRFFCDRGLCPRRTFVEPVAPAQRAVPPLQPRTEAVAACGCGRAGWSSRSTAVSAAAVEGGPDAAAGPAHGASRARAGAARARCRRFHLPQGEGVRHLEP